MPWLRVDDRMYCNRKVTGLSLGAKCLWMWALDYSSDQLTDGVLQPHEWQMLSAMLQLPDPAPFVAELDAAGLLDDGPNGNKILHDYLTYNPSRAEVLKDRAESAKRQAQWQAGKRREQPVQAPPPNAVPNSVTNPVTASVPYPYPYPVPSLSSLAPSTEDDPLVERLMQHGVTYTVGITLASGHDALVAAWLDYVDGHPNIPNVAAYLTKNIRAGRKPPTTGPPGKPPPAPDKAVAETLARFEKSGVLERIA